MRTDDERGGWRAPGCQAGPSPAVTTALAALDEALTALASVPLTTLPDGDVVRLLDGLTAITGRVTSTLGEVAVEADRRRLGDPAGARNTVTWWAHRTRLTRGEAGRVLALARDLEDDLHHPVADPLREGRLLPDQAGVIVHAVEQLPADLGRDVGCPCPRPPAGGRRPPRRPAAPPARAADPRRRRSRGGGVPRAATARGRGAAGGGTRAVHHGRRRARPVPRSVHVAHAAGPPAPRAPPRSRRSPPREPGSDSPGSAGHHPGAAGRGADGLRRALPDRPAPPPAATPPP